MSSSLSPMSSLAQSPSPFRMALSLKTPSCSTWRRTISSERFFLLSSCVCSIRPSFSLFSFLARSGTNGTRRSELRFKTKQLKSTNKIFGDKF